MATRSFRVVMGSDDGGRRPWRRCSIHDDFYRALNDRPVCVGLENRFHVDRFRAQLVDVRWHGLRRDGTTCSFSGTAPPPPRPSSTSWRSARLASGALLALRQSTGAASSPRRPGAVGAFVGATFCNLAAYGQARHPPSCCAWAWVLVRFAFSPRADEGRARGACQLGLLGLVAACSMPPAAVVGPVTRRR